MVKLKNTFDSELSEINLDIYSVLEILGKEEDFEDGLEDDEEFYDDVVNDSIIYQYGY